MDPVTILIGGAYLSEWTEMSLTRKKKDLTGSAEITVFYSVIPVSPIIVQAVAGVDVQIYIGGHIAFTGGVDSRSASADKDTYKITLQCRGKTRVLVDSSHQHKTGTILKTNTQKVTKTLSDDFGIDVDWRAEAQDIERSIFRDGAYVSDELHRLAAENSHFMFEGREGKLVVTDDTLQETGEPLIYADGGNILKFSVEQSIHNQKNKIKVKGKRTSKDIRGKASLLNQIVLIENKNVPINVPLTIHHFGDGKQSTLERRAKFEAGKRASESLKVNVDVLHVQTPSGNPWDVGMLHMVFIGSEGLSQTLECTDLVYKCTKDSITTSLTLAPPHQKSVKGSAQTLKSAAEAGKQVTTNGKYPLPWSGANLEAGTVPQEPIA
jgi:prophage tail gpP-like protein